MWNIGGGGWKDWLSLTDHELQSKVFDLNLVGSGASLRVNEQGDDGL